MLSPTHTRLGFTCYCAPRVWLGTEVPIMASVSKYPLAKKHMPLGTSRNLVLVLPQSYLLRRFDKYLAKEISSDIVYEDENVLAFRDIGSASCFGHPQVERWLDHAWQGERFGVGVTVGLYATYNPIIVNTSEEWEPEDMKC